MRAIPLLLVALLAGALGAAEDAAPNKGTPFLGVKIDLAASETVADGVVVRHVYPGSTAAALGLLVGDVITQANGQDVRSREHLVAVVDKTPVGEELSLKVRRGEQVKDLAGPMLKLPYQGRVLGDTRAAQQRIARLQEELARRGKGDDDIGLAMSMQMLATALNEFPEKLQAAAKEFKQVYPKGRFAIKIEIDITTDAEDDQAVDLSPENAPKLPEDVEKLLTPEAPEKAPAPKPDAP